MEITIITRDICGTMAGFRKHYANKEERCAPCKAASAEQRRNQIAKHPEKEKERRQKNYLDPTQRKKTRERKRRENHRARARSLNLEYEFYKEEDVINLYGSDCYLCNLPIDFSADRRPGQPEWANSFTTDHWIPMSKGGPDTLENIRPMHAKCNRSKFDKVIEE
jgi:hypothetical protein